MSEPTANPHIDSVWTEAVLLRTSLRKLEVEGEKEERLRDYAIANINLAIQMLDDLALEIEVSHDD